MQPLTKRHVLEGEKRFKKYIISLHYSNPHPRNISQNFSKFDCRLVRVQASHDSFVYVLQRKNNFEKIQIEVRPLLAHILIGESR